MIQRLTRLRARWRDLLNTVILLQKSQKRLENEVRLLDACIRTHLCFPEYQSNPDAAFNSQRERRRIIALLLDGITFEKIVETGTFIGDTTGHLAETTKLPVETAESDDRFFSLASNRLKNLPSVTVHHSDSRAFLKNLATREPSSRITFFYLDAHWNDDLPLREEISTIASHWDEFLILIDDFRVPADPGYGWDIYSAGNSLEYSLIADLAASFELRAYYPRVDSSKETGAKRGYIFLASGPISVELDAHFSHLLIPSEP